MQARIRELTIIVMTTTEAVSMISS
jgi:hypothetical protein